MAFKESISFAGSASIVTDFSSPTMEAGGMGNGEADVADLFTPTTEAEVRHVLNWTTNGALEKEESFESHHSKQRNSEEELMELLNIPKLPLLGVLAKTSHNSKQRNSEDELMELLNIPKLPLLGVLAKTSYQPTPSLRSLTETETETETKTVTETDRQTDRQTNRQTNRQTDKQADRQNDR